MSASPNAGCSAPLVLVKEPDADQNALWWHKNGHFLIHDSAGLCIEICSGDNEVGQPLHLWSIDGDPLQIWREEDERGSFIEDW